MREVANARGLVNADETLSLIKNGNAKDTSPAKAASKPNVHIRPDNKWVIYTGQFAAGERHVMRWP